VINPEMGITLTRVVCVEIRQAMPTEIIREFHRWCLENEVWEEGFGSFSGCGRYRGFYTEENAEKILEWAKERGLPFVNEDKTVAFSSLEVGDCFSFDFSVDRVYRKASQTTARLVPDGSVIWPGKTFVIPKGDPVRQCTHPVCKGGPCKHPNIGGA
jgi:hypothetical protein